MTLNEEESLLRWITVDQRECPPRPSRVHEMTNIFLPQRNPTSPPTIGKHWVAKFVKSQPEIKSQYSQK
jgi:hypothetical protein